MPIVTVTNDRYTTESVYQWSKNQKLKVRGLSLPSTPIFHFTNSAMDRTITRTVAVDATGVMTADIPNSLLQSPYNIKVYICVQNGETFRSLYEVSIPVTPRNKPADYTLELSDGEVYSFDKLERLVGDIPNLVKKETATIQTAVEKKCTEVIDKKFEELEVNPGTEATPSLAWRDTYDPTKPLYAIEIWGFTLKDSSDETIIETRTNATWVEFIHPMIPSDSSMGASPSALIRSRSPGPRLDKLYLADYYSLTGEIWFKVYCITDNTDYYLYPNKTTSWLQ